MCPYGSVYVVQSRHNQFPLVWAGGPTHAAAHTHTHTHTHTLLCLML